jgi:hypothetical protein
LARAIEEKAFSAKAVFLEVLRWHQRRERTLSVRAEHKAKET